MRLLYPLTCATLAAGLIFSSSAFAVDIEVKQAWIREAPPNAKVMAAYMEITNTGKTAVALQEVESGDFARAEIHKTEQHGDMSHMIKQTSVTIPAKSTVSFAPGGLHVMLFDPKSALKAGTKVKLSLRFSTGSLDVDADVKRGKSMDHDHSHHHEH